MNRELPDLASRTLGDTLVHEQVSLTGEDKLRELSFNLWWNRHTHVLEMFRQLDPSGRSETDHNPIAVWKRFAPARRHAAATDVGVRHQRTEVCP